MLYRAFWLLGNALLRALYGLAVRGAERVPEGGVVLAANHASFLDPVVLGVAVRRRVTFVARASLRESRLYRLFTWGLDVVHVDRDRGDREAIRRIVERLRKGEAVALFPEGTRSRTGAPGRPRRGFALAAKRAGVPVLPVWIEGTFAVWPPGRRLPRLRGRVEVRIGEPFEVVDPGEAAERLLAAWARLSGNGTVEREKTDGGGGSRRAPRQEGAGRPPAASRAPGRPRAVEAGDPERSPAASPGRGAGPIRAASER